MPRSEGPRTEGSPPPEELVALGAVTRPHGVLGEVRVHRFNPDSELLLSAALVFLRRDEVVRAYDVSAARLHKDVVLLTLVGVRGREAAEALRGAEVCVPRDALPEPDEGELYHLDLIGLAVVRPDGRALGEVIDVIAYPSVDCLLVEGEEGRRELPLLDPYVVEVDLEAGRVVVDHVEDFDLLR